MRFVKLTAMRVISMIDSRVRGFGFALLSGAVLLAGGLAPRGAEAAEGDCRLQPFEGLPEVSLSGLTITKRTVDCQTSSGTATSIVHVAEIDLSDDAVSLKASPLPGSDGYEVTQELPSRFLARVGAQLAINANLFSNCCCYSKDGVPANLNGWQVADGRQISAPLSNASAQPYPFDTSLTITGRVAEIVTLTTSRPTPPLPDVVVTGSHRLLRAGKNLAPFCTEHCDREFFGPNARTGAGLSADRRTLWLVTADGADPSAGIDLDGEAQLFRQLGASDAINLDGGGSSSMIASAGGWTRFVNAPSDPGQCTSKVQTPEASARQTCLAPVGNSGRCERFVGVSLGVVTGGQPRPPAGR